MKLAERDQAAWGFRRKRRVNMTGERSPSLVDKTLTSYMARHGLPRTTAIAGMSSPACALAASNSLLPPDCGPALRGAAAKCRGTSSCQTPALLAVAASSCPS